MNEILSEVILNPYGLESECVKFIIDDILQPFKFNDIKDMGNRYTFSTWIKADKPVHVVVNDEDFYFTEDWFKIETSFIADSNVLELYFCDTATYHLYHPKLELGDKATDWSPAPEDVQENIAIKPNTFIGHYITATNGEIVHFYTLDDEKFYCYKSIVDGETICYKVELVDGLYLPTETVIDVNDLNIVALETTPTAPYKLGDIWTTAGGFNKTCIVSSNSIFDNSHWSSSMEDLSMKLAEAQSNIQMLIDRISMIVVGENGGTLWEQTDEGIKLTWANTVTEVNDLAERLNKIESTTSNMDNDFSNVTSSVDAFNKVKPYINLKDIPETDEEGNNKTDENGNPIYIPCIELGAVNNKFKVQITNQKIQFTENDIVVAYIGNESLQITNAQINDSLYIGNNGTLYSMKCRPSGNLGISCLGTNFEIVPVT